MTVILAFDTSMAGCSAAVRDGAGGAFAHCTEKMTRGQSEMLVPMIERVMAESGIAYDRLDAIVTTIGPGAFTGLRIGLSAARAYGLALGRPVYGLTTLEVIAAMYADKGAARLWVVLETKRRDFYAQLFDGQAVALGAAVALPVHALRDMMHKGDVLIGDGAARFLRECDAADDLIFADGYDLPDPRVMIALAMDDLRKADRTILKKPDPLYLRGADVSQSKQTIRAIDDLSRL